MCDRQIKEIDEQIIALAMIRKQTLGLYRCNLKPDYAKLFIHKINCNYESYNTKYLIDVFNSINK